MNRRQRASPSTIRPPFALCANAVKARSISRCMLAHRPGATPLRATAPRPGSAANWPDPGRHGRISKDHGYSLRRARSALAAAPAISPLSRIFVDGKAGGVAARPRQARDKSRRRPGRSPIANTIGMVRVACSIAAVATLELVSDDVRRERRPIPPPIRGTSVILTAPSEYSIAHVARRRSSRIRCSALRERRQPGLSFRSSAGTVMSTPMRRHPLGLLRARRERPRRRRAAEQRDELAPVSFDHLVGAREQDVGGTVEAERPGGLEVDDQLELGRLHDRQVRRLRALEDACRHRRRCDGTASARLAP